VIGFVYLAAELVLAPGGLDAECRSTDIIKTIALPDMHRIRNSRQSTQ